VTSQRVQESVSCGIVGLAGSTEKRRRRGEECKEVQRPPADEPMQVPRSVDLRASYGVKTLFGLSSEWSIPQDASRMYDASKRRQLCENLAR